MKNLTEETVEGEPKTTFDDGPYGYWEFLGKGIIWLFVKGGKPKMNIAGDFILFPECSDVCVADKKVSEFWCRAGHFFRIKKGYKTKENEKMGKETYRLRCSVNRRRRRWGLEQKTTARILAENRIEQTAMNTEEGWEMQMVFGENVERSRMSFEWFFGFWDYEMMLVVLGFEAQ